MLLSVTIFSPRLTDTLTAETYIFNLLDNSVMFIPTPSPILNTKGNILVRICSAVSAGFGFQVNGMDFGNPLFKVAGRTLIY